MPKPAKGTPKEIANRCKSKGLQKLKWYCEMCQKQCRDQNGFKCHLMSENHQRQLLLFAENQKSYLRQFSTEFESNFMRVLRFTFGTKRVRANEVYQEYIKEKGHVHMNSTVWHTLTGFVLYLGDSGKCKIDQNDKGWHISYIDQESELRKQKAQKKAKNERDDEDRMNELLQKRIEKAIERYGKEVEEEGYAPKEFQRNDGEIVKFSFASSSSLLTVKSEVEVEFEEDIKPDFNKIKEEPINFDDLNYAINQPILVKEESKPLNIFEKDKSKKKLKHSSKPSTSSQKRSALDEIRDEQEQFKEKRNRKDFWLFKGIIVKLVSKKLGSKYYKMKGEVISVIDNYTAQIELDDGTIIKVDQSDLETVIPALGRDMLIVNGAYRGTKACLLEILEDKYMVKLKLKEGTFNGRVIDVIYEDASKINVEY